MVGNVKKIAKNHIKQHRPIDWFAIIILISFAIVVISVLANNIEQFEEDMEREAQQARAYMIYLQESRALERVSE